MKRLSSLALVVSLLAGCANFSVRGDEPKNTWTTEAGIDEVAGCLVTSLNAVNTGDALSPAITHAIQIIEPGRVYEVVYQQTLVVGGDPIYYVGLTDMGDEVEVSLYALSTWVDSIRPAVESCV